MLYITAHFLFIILSVCICHTE